MWYRANSETSATLIGAAAVLLWSCLAPLTAAAHGIPPLQLLAATFGTAFVCGLLGVAVVGGRSALRRLWQPFGYFAFAATALFGYHVLYFTALTLAPPAQASLVAYLWPLLIVLFAAVGARGKPLRTAHILGTLLGLAGTTLLVLSPIADGITSPHRFVGLLAALGCALTWSSYSVLNRRFRNVPTEAMVVVCGIVAALGLTAHWLLGEHPTVPHGPQWLAIVALGVGPVGLAFFAWDHGTKQGNVSLLGTISYAAPVLSTLLLVASGRTPASVRLLAACVLVPMGAWVATRAAKTPRTVEHGEQLRDDRIAGARELG